MPETPELRRRLTTLVQPADDVVQAKRAILEHLAASGSTEGR